MKYIINSFVLISVLLLSSCEGGLEPLGANKGVISGTVYYHNDWFPDSTIKDIRVVAFKEFPPTDILNEVLSGNAIFSESLIPSSKDSSNFSIDVLETPMLFKYIAVARQYGTLFEWDAIGVYSQDTINRTPIEITLGKNSQIKISIDVDFKNLPPQPF